MTTEYSSPYKVGLINVGTKFVQSSLVWSEVAYGRLNFRGAVIRVKMFVASANLVPHQSAQVIIQRGTRYVDFFFVTRLDFRFGPFPFFPVFDSTCDLISDSASKNVKAWYRRCFDSKPPISLRTVRGPWCVSFEVSRFMDTCHTPRSSEPGCKILVGARPIYYLISVNG